MNYFCKKTLENPYCFLVDGNVFELPASIKTDMQAFADMINTDLPDNAIFREMGLGNVNGEKLFMQILQNFNLNK